MRAEEFCNLQLLRFKKQKLFKISNIQLEKQYFFLQWRQIYIDKNITSVNSTSIFLYFQYLDLQFQTIPTNLQQ